jgi:hypothetical protein
MTGRRDSGQGIAARGAAGLNRLAGPLMFAQKIREPRSAERSLMAFGPIRIWLRVCACSQRFFWTGIALAVQAIIINRLTGVRYVVAAAGGCGTFTRIISGIVRLELFASAAAIQPSAAALEAGLMEQEQHYPCSGVLP